MLRHHFKEFTWLLLSVFNGIDKKELVRGDAYLKELYSVEGNLNKLYIKNKKKTQKLYEKFVRTDMFKTFLKSESLAQLFN